jgi:hypothetical protein
MIIMAVLKLNKSGRSILVIDDDGRTYITSVEHIRRLADGKFNNGFIVLTRLPGDNASNRFPESPVWNPDTGTAVIREVDSTGNQLTTNNDALSQQVLKKKGDVQVKDVIL